MNRKLTIKQRKGISLIVLVITIIVMLILTGATIITLIGDNGIITKEQWASFSTEMQNIIEQVQVTQISEAASGYGLQENYLSKIKVEDAQKLNKTLKQEILYILDLMPKESNPSDYPEYLFNQRSDAQGYLKDIYHLEIDGLPKQQFLYDTLRGVVYKKMEQI